MSSRGSRITCPACHNDTYLKREPVYEGFKKVGETLSCVDCGHVFENDDEAPEAKSPLASIFSDDDRPQKVNVFAEGEQAQICRYCTHYVVNPFAQRCDHHNRETEATDSCSDFEKVEEEDEAEESSE